MHIARSGDRLRGRSRFGAAKARAYTGGRVVGRVLLLLLALVLIGPAASGADGETPRILFVHLQVNQGAFTVVSATNVPGLLKPQRSRAENTKEYRIVIEDADGKELASTTIDDPCLLHLEDEDAAQPGVLRRREIRRSEAELSVRFPAREGQRQLAIYRRPEPAPPKVPDASSKARELVSRLPLPSPVRLPLPARP